MRRFDEAIADYGKVILINPLHHEAYASRGITFNRLSNFTEALIDFEKVLEINPDD